MNRKTTTMPEYKVWTGMKERCGNKNALTWTRYGARGISVCERWSSSFERFLADMGPRPSSNHSINRIDNDGPYSPENCHWATAIEQNNNRRNNVFFMKDGESKTLREWSKTLSLDIPATRRLLKAGNGFTRVTPIVKSKGKGGVGRPPKMTPCPWCKVPHPVGKLRAHMTQCGRGR